MIEDLEQFFLGPWRGALSTEVVEDKDRRVTHLLEEGIVRHFTPGIESAAQVVEQVRDNDKKSGLSVFDAVICDGRRHVGLSGPGRPVNYDPTLRRFGKGGSPDD